MSIEENLAYWKSKGAPGLMRHKGTSKITNVIGEEGTLAGQIVGSQTEHWSDRVDAHINKYETYITPLGTKGVENVINA